MHDFAKNTLTNVASCLGLFYYFYYHGILTITYTSISRAEVDCLQY